MFVFDYILRAKTLANHLDAVDEVILECEMVLYILNGLGPQYLTFVTTFNMIQVKLSTGVLHNQLENFDIILSVFEGVNQYSIFQTNVANAMKHIPSSHSNKQSYGKSYNQSKLPEWNFHQFVKDCNLSQKNSGMSFSNSSIKNVKKTFQENQYVRFVKR